MQRSVLGFTLGWTFYSSSGNRLAPFDNRYELFRLFCVNAFLVAYDALSSFSEVNCRAFKNTITTDNGFGLKPLRFSVSREWTIWRKKVCWGALRYANHCITSVPTELSHFLLLKTVTVTEGSWVVGANLKYLNGQKLSTSYYNRRHVEILK